MFNNKRYIAVKENIVIKDFESSYSPDEIKKALESQSISFDFLINIPHESNCYIGININELDYNWKLKLPEVRIREGYVKIPNGYIFDGKTIRKTLYEKIKNIFIKEK
jgi:hypothetical protein